MSEKQTGNAQYRDLDIKLLIPTPDNPRTVNEKSPSFIELFESIQKEGVKTPVPVRPHPTEKGKFDMRAGARRLRAAKKAGLKVIPAVVYENMSDTEAFDMTHIENFGREDLTPLEESKNTATMLAKYGNDCKVVADKLGKTEHWVRMRSNVHTGLSPEWKKEIEKENSKLSEWTISHYELIARFDRGIQNQFLAEFNKNPWMVGRYKNLKDLSQRCNEMVMVLKKAMWELDEILTAADNGQKLPKCSICKKRSGCKPMLWVEDAEKEKPNDSCLDVVCWNRKVTAANNRNIEKYKAQYPNLVLLANNADYQEARKMAEVFSDLTDGSEFDSAKKADKTAVPCYVVCGKSAGSLVWRKPMKGSSSKPEKIKGEKAAKPLADRQKELEKKRWFWVLGELTKLVDTAHVEQIIYENKPLALMALIVQFGTYPSFCQCSKNWETMKETLSPKNQKDAVNSLPHTLFEMVKPRLIETFAYNGPLTQTPDGSIDAAKQVAELLAIDIEDLFAKACEEYKIPKSWAKLES